MSNDGQYRKEDSQEYPLQSGTDGMVLFSVLILQLASGYYNVFDQCIAYIHGLMQERRNSIANALELGLSCTIDIACFRSPWWFPNHYG